MYYSYVEIEYVATSFSPARTDLALKLLIVVVIPSKEARSGFEWCKSYSVLTWKLLEMNMLRTFQNPI